jgi:hypothetical protein
VDAAGLLADQADQRAGEAGTQGQHKPVVADRGRRDPLLPSLQRTGARELGNVPRVLMLEQHLVAERRGPEHLPGQHERVVVPAEPVDAAVTDLGPPRLDVLREAVACRLGGADLEPKAKELGAHLIAASRQQARGHGPLVHHTIGVRDPEQDAPVL